MHKFHIYPTKFDGLGHHKTLKVPEILLQHSNDYPASLMYFIQNNEKRFRLFNSYESMMYIKKNIIHMYKGLILLNYSPKFWKKKWYYWYASKICHHCSSTFLKLGCIWTIFKILGKYPLRPDKWDIWTKGLVTNWTQCSTFISGTSSNKADRQLFGLFITHLSLFSQ